MELYQQEVAGTAVLVIVGRVTVDDAPALAERLALALTEHSHRLILDLSRVDFMGSAGLGALITATKTARANGGDIVFAAPSAVVQSLLHVSGLLDFVLHSNATALAVGLLPA